MAERAGLILIKCLFKSNIFENYNWFPPAMPLTKPLSQRSLKSSQLMKNPSWQPFFPEKEAYWNLQRPESGIVFFWVKLTLHVEALKLQVCLLHAQAHKQEWSTFLSTCLPSHQYLSSYDLPVLMKLVLLSGPGGKQQPWPGWTAEGSTNTAVHCKPSLIMDS